MSRNKLKGLRKEIDDLNEKNKKLLDATTAMAGKLEYLLNKYHLTALEFEAEYNASLAPDEAPPQEAH